MIAFLLAQTIAITGGTVYPVSGPKIENATVLIRDGKIAAVGANVAVPTDATRIDASGKWVTPGFIDGAGQMGLREIGAVDNTNEATLRGNEVAASFNVLEGINPASTLIAVNRMEGDRKSTRLNSSHSQISYAVFCLKKKNNVATARRSQSLSRSPYNASHYP